MDSLCSVVVAVALVAMVVQELVSSSAEDEEQHMGGVRNNVGSVAGYPMLAVLAVASDSCLNEDAESSVLWNWIGCVLTVAAESCLKIYFEKEVLLVQDSPRQTPAFEDSLVG